MPSSADPQPPDPLRAPEGKPSSAAATPARPTRNPLKRLYRWVLSWAHHPAGTWALAVFAFLDSSVFPVPPLFLQVALSLERPRRSWWYAAVDTVASVLGACLGFLIGYALFETVGRRIIHFYGLEKEFASVGDYFGKNAFTFILIYSFIPFPYKVITIGSGFYHDKVAWPVLLAASTIGRGFRFFALAAVCWYFGARAASFIDRYFNWVMLAIGLFAAGVIVVMKVWLGR